MDLVHKHCILSDESVSAFNEDQEQLYSQQVPTWMLLRNNNHKLRKLFTFMSFKQAIDFVNAVATIAEQEGHYPTITIMFTKVQLDLFTLAADGLSENDFILASKIDTLLPQV